LQFAPGFQDAGLIGVHGIHRGQGANMRALLALLLLASPALAQNQTPPTVPQSACGRGDVEYNVKKDQGQHIPEADPTKALVYIIQDEQTIGFCIKCTITTRIGLDGSWIGANNGASYFSLG
jgi:hypothetical protein